MYAKKSGSTIIHYSLEFVSKESMKGKRQVFIYILCKNLLKSLNMNPVANLQNFY